MVSIQVFLLPKMSICWRKFALMGTSLRANHATAAATSAHGTKTIAALWTKISLPAWVRCGAIKVMPSNPNPIIHGPRNWMREIPKLPMPACKPNAVPDRRLGKKYPVEGMKPEKTPPPMPQINDNVSKAQYGVLVFWTAKNHPTMGMMNSSEGMVTSLRVPMMGGRNVKIRRKNPQASPGIAVNQYSWLFDREKPMSLSRGAIAETRYHVQKPIMRENVEIHRVRHAMPESQFFSSSGSQLLRTCPFVDLVSESGVVISFTCPVEGGNDGL